jgi:tetratricopeptide (TPR) repeat protein
MAKAMAAGAYRELGNYAKAEEYIKDAYMTIVTQQGEENVPASVILNGMGLLYKRQGKFELGVDAYDRALKIREELLG